MPLNWSHLASTSPNPISTYHSRRRPTRTQNIRISNLLPRRRGATKLPLNARQTLLRPRCHFHGCAEGGGRHGSGVMRELLAERESAEKRSSNGTKEPLSHGGCVPLENWLWTCPGMWSNAEVLQLGTGRLNASLRVIPVRHRRHQSQDGLEDGEIDFQKLLREDM